ncbi:unnamed protein product [Lampetra planeri]
MNDRRSHAAFGPYPFTHRGGCVNPGAAGADERERRKEEEEGRETGSEGPVFRFIEKSWNASHGVYGRVQSEATEWWFAHFTTNTAKLGFDTNIGGDYRNWF